MNADTTSGEATAAVPAEVDRWNWGAFLLSWIWGIGNKTPIALFALVPVLGLVMLPVLGFKGSAWAWRNKHWQSIEAFRCEQRNWAIAGAALWVIALLLVGLAVAVFFAVAIMLKSSDAYQLGVHTLKADRQAVALLGRPVDTGIPSGSIHLSGPDGRASLSFRAEGPNGEGSVYIKATRSMGQWHIDQAQLASAGQRIDLAD